MVGFVLVSPGKGNERSKDKRANNQANKQSTKEQAKQATNQQKEQQLKQRESALAVHAAPGVCEALCAACAGRRPAEDAGMARRAMAEKRASPERIVEC